MKHLFKTFMERMFGPQDEFAPRKCACCAREMTYFPHLPVAAGQGITPTVARWRCIFCGR